MIRYGPSGLPEAESPEAAISQLVARGYSACEIGFGGGFFAGDKEWMAELGGAAAAAGVSLSLHAPLAAFLGHAEPGPKLKRAVGMLDHTAGLARASGAEVVVVHPGFLLGRERERALEDVAAQLAELRARLEAKDRAVPFGMEVMGRVRELGSVDDVIWLAQRLPWVRPVLDFAHLHAVTDGAYLDTAAFAETLSRADAVLPAGAPFHVHFSDIAYANRNENRHLPYGEGTLRVEPLRDALALFERPATVISESPDEASTRAIGAVLLG